jgi:hypothetical protein
MRWRGGGLTLVLAVSCTRGGLDLAGRIFVPRDGARLAVRWARGPADSFAVLGFVDSGLGVPCSFATAADGELRCLPSGPLLPGPATQFADPDCSRAVVVDPEGACRDTPYLVLLDTSRSCEPRRRIHRAGPPIEGLTYGQRNGACAPSALPDGSRAHIVGDEVPPDGFVRGTVAAGDEGEGKGKQQTGPIQLLVLRSDDGGRAPWRWRDAATTRECAPAPMGDGKVHCLPAAVPVAAGIFADPGCRAPAALAARSCGPADELALAPEGDRCSAAVSLRVLGAPVATAYERRAGLCSAIGAGSALAYRELGAPVAPEAVPAFDRVVEPGAGGLHPVVLVAPGGVGTRAGWLDGAGEACLPGEVGGRLRCVPAAGTFSGYYYADEQCTRPIFRGNGPCPPRFAQALDRSTCPVSTHWYTVGEIQDGPVYMQSYALGETRSPLLCAPFRPLDGDEFRIMVPIADDAFAELSRSN